MFKECLRSPLHTCVERRECSRWGGVIDRFWKGQASIIRHTMCKAYLQMFLSPHVIFSITTQLVRGRLALST